MKVCKRCKEEKGYSEYGRDKRLKDGLTIYCRPCDSIRMAEWRAKQDPKKLALKERDNHLRRTYGMTLEQYEEMLTKQGGVCLLCDRTAEEAHPDKRALVVDHCHDTGAVRGLLCSQCNSAIHRIEIDPAWAVRAVAYVQLAQIQGGV
jgi:hypothetical protein